MVFFSKVFISIFLILFGFCVLILYFAPELWKYLVTILVSYILLQASLEKIPKERRSIFGESGRLVFVSLASAAIAILFQRFLEDPSYLAQIVKTIALLLSFWFLVFTLSRDKFENI